MAEELTVGKVHAMLEQHLSKRSDLGIWNAVDYASLDLRNPFEPESAGRPQRWFVLFSTLGWSPSEPFVYFNLWN